MSAPLIAIREFARRDGCDEKLVRNAIRDGHLSAMGRGKIDAALVGTGWRLRNRRGADTAANAAESPQTVDCASVAKLARQIAESSPTPPLAVSEARKTHYLALLRELEYETKRGKLLSDTDVDQLLGTIVDAQRTAFLHFATKAAEALVGETDRRRVVAILTEMTHEILQQLSEIKIVQVNGQLVQRSQVKRGNGHA